MNMVMTYVKKMSPAGMHKPCRRLQTLNQSAINALSCRLRDNCRAPSFEVYS